MLTQAASARQRRALNQVWDASGDYDSEPLFLAVRQDGTPDLYMNCIVGCAQKRYSAAALSALFDAWAGDVRQAALDELAWLALENAVYLRELPVRGVLAQLRTEHAKGFFAQEYRLSRQEWMAKNQLVYTLQAARWRMVLGQRPPVMTPRERELFQALSCAGEGGGEALRTAVLDAFAAARLFSGHVRGGNPLRLHFIGRWAQAAARLLPTEIVHTDMLSVGRSQAAGAGGGGARLDLKRAVVRLNENAGTDQAYIESCFGPSLLSPRELAQAQQALCTGNHLGCKLWFTAGAPDAHAARTGEAELLAREAELQEQRNRAAFRKDLELYRGAIHRLTEQILNCIQVHSQTETVIARCGRLDSARAWRGAVVDDERVFLRESESAVPSFSVDLLLDASASRLHCQEAIAAQGCILAESLSRCGVRVRVTSFCSLRGYTVLRVLKDYGERNTAGSVFRYFAAGWNRDGLALRAAGYLMARAPGARRFLLLLTDASPNDSHRIPPNSGAPFGQDYDGESAVSDAAAQVRALRRANVSVAAVYMGTDENVRNAGLIYGKSFVRIRSMDQLARAAGGLIQEELRELSG